MRIRWWLLLAWAALMIVQNAGCGGVYTMPVVYDHQQTKRDTDDLQINAHKRIGINDRAFLRRRLMTVRRLPPRNGTDIDGAVREAERGVIMEGGV